LWQIHTYIQIYRYTPASIDHRLEVEVAPFVQNYVMLARDAVLDTVAVIASVLWDL